MPDSGYVIEDRAPNSKTEVHRAPGGYVVIARYHPLGSEAQQTMVHVQCSDEEWDAWKEAWQKQRDAYIKESWEHWSAMYTPRMLKNA